MNPYECFNIAFFLLKESYNTNGCISNCRFAFAAVGGGVTAHG
jgi:hypothetical protein